MWESTTLVSLPSAETYGTSSARVKTCPGLLASALMRENSAGVSSMAQFPRRTAFLASSMTNCASAVDSCVACDMQFAMLI